MDTNLIFELINSLKMIIDSDKVINIPDIGKKNRIELKSSNYLFIVDLNRGGHKKPKCTYQLREMHYKDVPLLRLDLIGRTHRNPPGDFPYADEDIPCPHMHIADQEYGTSIAYPLDSTYAKMILSDDEIADLGEVLKQFLEICNTGNLDDYIIRYQETMF